MWGEDTDTNLLHHYIECKLPADGFRQLEAHLRVAHGVAVLRAIVGHGDSRALVQIPNIARVES
jgi:hypothetical protein